MKMYIKGILDINRSFFFLGFHLGKRCPCPASNSKPNPSSSPSFELRCLHSFQCFRLKIPKVRNSENLNNIYPESYKLQIPSLVLPKTKEIPYKILTYVFEDKNNDKRRVRIHKHFYTRKIS